VAERRALVLVNGRVQELPSGDTLAGGGTTDYPMIKDTVDDGDTVTITAGYQMIVGSGFTVDGELVIDGELVVV
jgi:hypothetical protein